MFMVLRLSGTSESRDCKTWRMVWASVGPAIYTDHWIPKKR